MSNNNLSMIERLQRQNNNTTTTNVDFNNETSHNDFNNFTHNDNDNDNDRQEMKEEKEQTTEEKESKFQCSICMDICQNPVVTQCGHMYCWECIRDWLDRQHSCPICKAQVTEETIIPIYTGSDTTDPRSAPRPEQHYTPQPEQPRRTNRNPFMFGGFGSPHVSFGFGLPGMMFTMGNLGNLFNRRFDQNENDQNGNEMTEEQRRQQKRQMILVLIIVFMPLILRFISMIFFPVII